MNFQGCGFPLVHFHSCCSPSTLFHFFRYLLSLHILHWPWQEALGLLCTLDACHPGDTEQSCSGHSLLRGLDGRGPGSWARLSALVDRAPQLRYQGRRGREHAPPLTLLEAGGSLLNSSCPLGPGLQDMRAATLFSTQGSASCTRVSGGDCSSTIWAAFFQTETHSFRAWAQRSRKWTVEEVWPGSRPASPGSWQVLSGAPVPSLKGEGALARNFPHLEPSLTATSGI